MYTIDDKEIEFRRHLRDLVEEFLSAIEDDDKSQLNKNTIDIIKIVKS